MAETQNRRIGQVIAIEGLNAAGKSVFSAQLQKELTSAGLKSLIVKVPLYDIQNDHIDHNGPDLYDFLNRGKSFSAEAVDIMFRVNRRYI